MWSCDQSLVTLAFLWEKLSQPQFYKDLTRKTTFFEGWSWFKFNNLVLALGTNFKFYTSVAKRLKLKVRKFWGLISTFVEVTGEKLVAGAFLLASPSWVGLIRSLAWACNFIKKETQLWHRCFPVNFVNNFFTEHLWMTAPVRNHINIWKFQNRIRRNYFKIYCDKD